MNFNEYPDREFLFLQLANRIASELADFLRREGKATLCVPGGTTPGPIFDTLSGVDLDWANVTVFLNDERWLPEDSPRSNTRLLRKHLLKGHAAAARYVPLYAPTETPEESMDALITGVEPYLPISVLLLGMGGDMHTASLFPGADRLEEGMSDKAPLLLPMRADGAGEPRITLTARALKGAMSPHLVITGPEKRDALERAEKMTPMEAPIRAFMNDLTVHWAE